MLSRALSATVAQPSSALWTELSTLDPVRGALPSDTLACIGYGAHLDEGEDPRRIAVGLSLLGGDRRCELWRTAGTVRADRDAGFGFAHDGTVLFGHLTLLDCELESIAAATFRAYARITAFLDRQGYPRLLRCWNYVHDINRGEHDRELYRQFCVGRYQALSSAPGFERQLPAGTAIGMEESGLVIYFLAAQDPGRQVENPRQMPAFHYPRQYGPRSPSFSRATFRPADRQLLVSGTASIIGHATQHPYDTAAQLDETVANLKALVEHVSATELGGADPACWTPQSLKVYVRDRADAGLVRRRLDAAYGARAPILLLEGAICRRDLKIEIEGVWSAATS